MKTWAATSVRVRPVPVVLSRPLSSRARNEEALQVMWVRGWNG